MFSEWTMIKEEKEKIQNPTRLFKRANMPKRIKRVPAILFTRVSPLAVIFSLKKRTRAVSNANQLKEPRKIPVTRNVPDQLLPIILLSPTLAKTAAKTNIVIGLVSVRRNEEINARRCLLVPFISVSVEVCEWNVRYPSIISRIPPIRRIQYC